MRIRTGGMTLIELMIAMALSLILVGTASFVFIESQKIMSRVDTRLKAAQSFRVTATILDADGARIEPTASFNTATPPVLQLKKIASGGAWFSLTRVDAGGPELRQDVVRMVTHANLALFVAGKVQPPANQTVLVTYQIKPGRGLVRSLDLLTVSTNAGSGVITATIDNSSLPNNQGITPTSLDMDLAPGATGFSVRYLRGGEWRDPGPKGAPPPNSDLGNLFMGVAASAMPSGLEFTVYIPETDRPDSARLSLVKSVELLPPPP